MTIIGAYLGGNPPELAAGRAGLSLCITTTDRLNQDTASWTITATGFSETVDADETGRAYVELPSGPIYTVKLNHGGSYQNDLPQTFKAESRKHYGVYFDLFTYPEVNTMLKVITRPKTTVTITSGSNSMTAVADANGYAYFNGLPVDSTWNVTIRGESKDVTIHNLYSEIEVGNYYIYGIRISRSISDPESACEYTDDAVGFTPASGHNMNDWAGTPLFDGIRPVVLKSGPTKTYLDRRDLTKTVSGEDSKINVAGNDAMVEIPLIYMYFDGDNDYVYIKYSNRQVDGFNAYAHTQSGQIQDYFYFSCFSGTVVSGKMYSMIGATSEGGDPITSYTSWATARGNGFDITPWFQDLFVQGLMLLAYKTRRLSDHLLGYSGTIQANTTSTFDNDYGISGSQSGTSRISFLWIWDIYGNVGRFLGRVKTSSDCKLMVIMNGYSSFDDSAYELQNTSLSEESGYISDIDGGSKTGFFPKSLTGSSSTYWCAYCMIEGSSYLAHTYGGRPFTLRYFSSSAGQGRVCARLSYCLGIS